MNDFYRGEPRNPARAFDEEAMPASAEGLRLAIAYVRAWDHVGRGLMSKAEAEAAFAGVFNDGLTVGEIGEFALAMTCLAYAVSGILAIDRFGSTIDVLLDAVAERFGVNE